MKIYSVDELISQAIGVPNPAHIHGNVVCVEGRVLVSGLNSELYDFKRQSSAMVLFGSTLFESLRAHYAPGSYIGGRPYSGELRVTGVAELTGLELYPVGMRCIHSYTFTAKESVTVVVPGSRFNTQPIEVIGPRSWNESVVRWPDRTNRPMLTLDIGRMWNLHQWVNQFSPSMRTEGFDAHNSPEERVQQRINHLWGTLKDGLTQHGLWPDEASAEESS